MVVEFITIVTALILIIIVFFVSRKMGHDDDIDSFSVTVHPSQSYKIPEFEYTRPDAGLSAIIDGSNITGELSHALRRKIKTVTPATPAGIKLLRYLKAPDTRGEQIAAVVATSPIFSIHVLRTVNSPRSKSSSSKSTSKVNSVGMAILMMGYHEFKKLIMSCNLDDFLSRLKDKDLVEVYYNLWLHSAMVSTCAVHLGQHVFHRYQQELATMGLFHDIGKYYLPLFNDRRQAVAEGVSCIGRDAEYGFNHAILSSYVAEECNLPDTIVKAVYYHHHPQFFPPEKIPMDFRLPSFILCLADLICKAYGYHSKGEQIYPIREEYFEMYDINLKSVFSKKLEKSLSRCRSTVESFGKY